MDRKLNCMKSMAKIGMIVVPVAIATKIIIDKSVVNYEKRQRQNIEQIKRKVIDNISMYEIVNIACIKIVKKPKIRFNIIIDLLKRRSLRKLDK